MEYIVEHGQPEAEHRSHDHLNQLPDVPIPDELTAKWQRRFAELSDRPIILLEGFLLFYDHDVARHIDVRVLMRDKRDVLKHRRETRSTYVRRSLV